MAYNTVFTVCPAPYARLLMIIVNYLQRLILRTFEDMERQQILEVLEKTGAGASRAGAEPRKSRAPPEHLKSRDA